MKIFIKIWPFKYFLMAFMWEPTQGGCGLPSQHIRSVRRLVPGGSRHILAALGADLGKSDTRWVTSGLGIERYQWLWSPQMAGRYDSATILSMFSHTSQSVSHLKQALKIFRPDMTFYVLQPPWTYLPPACTGPQFPDPLGKARKNSK